MLYHSFPVQYKIKRERKKEKKKNKMNQYKKESRYIHRVNQDIYENKAFTVSSKTTIKTYCMNVCIY